MLHMGSGVDPILQHRELPELKKLVDVQDRHLLFMKQEVC